MLQISPSLYKPESLIRIPSPLAPFNPNACPRFSLQMASVETTDNATSSYSHKRVTYNPLLLRKPKEEQDRRRQVFLNKVRQLSDDKNWESRSEQILRKDFLSRQKEWELDQARSAPEPPQALDDDEREEESSSMAELDMVDQILSQENQEFEAFVSLMQDDANQGDHHQQNQVFDYGSDGEEYDQLFKEVMSRQAFAERSIATFGDGAAEQDQEMDVSFG